MDILEEVITGYRAVINQRYQYGNLVDKYNIPNSISEQVVGKIRDYFLTYIYPDFKRRNELNEAFESLDNFVKRPEHLLRLLFDSVKLVFTHGRHLPKIFATGLKALKSYRMANDFENKLVHRAIEHKITGPFDERKINRLIKLLSRHEIEQFIEYNQALLEILHDRVLVKKIKEILIFLITKMKLKNKIYSSSEVQGLEIGLEMLEKGDAIFEQIKCEDRQVLIDLIMQVEKDVLDSIFP